MESIDRTAVQPDPASEQDLTVDHLGDVSESLRRGLPVYRLKGGPGYLWSATSDRSGRGHLRFLALDEPALTAAKERAASQPVQAAPTQELMETAALAARRDGAGFATGKDLRAFLTPQPTSMLQNGPERPPVHMARTSSNNPSLGRRGPMPIVQGSPMPSGSPLRRKRRRASRGRGTRPRPLPTKRGRA